MTPPEDLPPVVDPSLHLANAARTLERMLEAEHPGHTVVVTFRQMSDEERVRRARSTGLVFYSDDYRGRDAKES
jgi:hypothetical protein